MPYAMALAIASFLIFVAFLVSMFAYYSTYIYKADVAKDWLDLAKVSNNLPVINKDINQAIDILKNYHGSPLVYPTPNMNYDNIRANLQDVVKTNNAFATADTSMSYQQLIANHKSILENAQGDLSNANFDWSFNPKANPVVLVFLIITVPIMIASVLVPEAVQKRRNRRINTIRP